MKPSKVIAVWLLVAYFIWQLVTGISLSLMPISDKKPVVASSDVLITGLIISITVNFASAAVTAKYISGDITSCLLLGITLITWIITFITWRIEISYLNWLITGIALWISTSNQLHKLFSRVETFLILFSVALLGTGLGCLFSLFLWKRFMEPFNTM